MVRKFKEDKPVLAICYDFDKTLSPDDMQAQGYIQSVGHDIKDFWEQSNALATDNDMDQNLAYMYMMKQEAEGKVLFTKEKLAEYGAKVQLFPGVEQWFERIRQYGKEKGVLVEHYIISSGLKEIIPVKHSFYSELKKEFWTLMILRSMIPSHLRRSGSLSVIWYISATAIPISPA